ncbi:phage tail protein [Streptomyces sp. WAC06614]|uniref:phage tail protein n=1 Tax=Streptomyces sp. WAC06614 TaxID=2487416 RepID=UPI000F7954D2|nr:phage tail protein [Streptomyces sp. WAC06614]RSS67424.1 phage tail protein [Streptomyces sp. WAC06614]
MAFADTSTLALSNRFVVELDEGRINLGSWAQCQGLEVTWKMADYRAGDAGNDRWFYPGFTEYPNIKLTRAACQDSPKVQGWLSENSFGNKPGTQTGAIILYDPNNKEVIRWNLKSVSPVKWAIGGFEAGTSKVALETLELTHNGFLNDGNKPAK